MVYIKHSLNEFNKTYTKVRTGKHLFERSCTQYGLKNTTEWANRKFQEIQEGLEFDWT
jgi:hypothetical protein